MIASPSKWDEQREREREELKVRRQEHKRQAQQLDSDEFDVRGAVEIEEDDAWEDVRYDMEKLYDKALKMESTFKKIHQQEADVESLRRKVDEELREQEERIALLLQETAAIEAAKAAKAAPKVQHVDPEDNTVAAAVAPTEPSRLQESMNYWIRQLDKSDDDVLAQMETDLQGFLKELEPGLPTVRNITDHASGAPAKQVKKPLQSMQRAVTQAVAVTSAALRDGGSKGSSREALWESFYAWETRHQK